MQTNQSNMSTNLKKQDFVIQEIEVTSQSIDLKVIDKIMLKRCSSTMTLPEVAIRKYSH